MIEQFADLAVSSLNGGINAAVTSLIVASATSFQDINNVALTGNFRILIDSEILLVTAVSGNTFTVSRGYEGTTAASHSNAATVTAVLTAGSLLRAYGVPQENYPIYSDPFGTWVNQKTSTVTTANGIQYLLSPADTADSWTFYVKTTPTPPYTCIFRMLPFLAGGDFSAFGAVWYDSGTGNFKMIQRFHNVSTYQLNVSKGGGSPPTVSSDYKANGNVCIYEWFRLKDDNTNQIYSVSPDGQNWIDILSHARNTDVAPNRVGIAVNARNAVSQPAAISLRSYQETA